MKPSGLRKNSESSVLCAFRRRAHVTKKFGTKAFMKPSSIGYVARCCSRTSALIAPIAAAYSNSLLLLQQNAFFRESHSFIWWDDNGGNSEWVVKSHDLDTFECLGDCREDGALAVVEGVDAGRPSPRITLAFF